MSIASETAARIDLYVELLCLEAADRAVVEYFDVSVGWAQQQQQQLEQQQPEQQLEQQQQQQRRERLRVWVMMKNDASSCSGYLYVNSGDCFRRSGERRE